jgi:hypothetical protein
MAMNGEVFTLAQRLQKGLQSLDPKQDRDTLVWAHGLLTGIVNHIQSHIPDLITTSTLSQSSRAELDALIAKMGKRRAGGESDEDSLETIERELGCEGDVPVPARRKPGPKGLSGGAALQLPDPDVQM